MRLAILLFLAHSAAALADPALVGITPAVGPTVGGTTVTITITAGAFACGIDPCTGPQLFIGGVSVPYTSPTPTTLVAITPPHAPGPVDVELRPGIGGIGTSSFLLNAFLYQGNDIPALTPRLAALVALALAALGAVVLRRS